MLNEFILVMAQLGIIAVAGAGAALFARRDFRPGWFVLALALYGLYDLLLTRGFFAFDNWPADAAWNWLGKGLALAAMLGIAALPALGFRRCGLRWAQDKGAWPAFAVLGGLGAMVFYFAITGGDGRDDWETIAFQWTMPGLDEEIFYRGVLLLMLNEAFRGRVRVLGAPIGVGGLLTSLLFGLAHGLSYSAIGFEFELMTFLMTGVPSLLLLWMREKTGSVVVPILAHNMINGAFTLF